MQILPIKEFLGRYDNACCRFLIQDKRFDVKGVWSMIISIPAVIIVLFTKNPQVIVTYTGGICGTFMLLIFPVTFFLYAKKKLASDPTLSEMANPNNSWFRSNLWGYGIYAFSFITIFSVLWGAAHGNSGE